jgi:hypothetical protein
MSIECHCLPFLYSGQSGSIFWRFTCSKSPLLMLFGRRSSRATSILHLLLSIDTSFPSTLHVNISLHNFNMGSKTPKNHQQTPNGMIPLSQPTKSTSRLTLRHSFRLRRTQASQSRFQSLSGWLKFRRLGSRSCQQRRRR